MGSEMGMNFLLSKMMFCQLLSYSRGGSYPIPSSNMYKVELREYR